MTLVRIGDRLFNPQQVTQVNLQLKDDLMPNGENAVQIRLADGSSLIFAKPETARAARHYFDHNVGQLPRGGTEVLDLTPFANTEARA